MKISILTPNLSGNCTGRAWVLGKLLAADFEVEIVGPTESGKLWAPLEDEKDIDFVPVKAYSKTSESTKQSAALRKAITGEAIYVSKPLWSIMRPAIQEKRLNKKKFFLDIDDWQMGFQYKKLYGPLGFCRVFSSELVHACGFDSFWNALAGEKHIKHADAISVSNAFLQKRYGGILVPHARDGSFLDPLLYEKDTIKEELGFLPTDSIVSFIGSPRPHKGVEDLIEAVARITDRNVKLMVVGLSSDEFSNIIRKSGQEKLGDRFTAYGVQPYANLPRFLSISDVVVIPQRNTSATVGQTPAKVFDAMAMGKPIVATNVGDLPEILKGCGLITQPGESNMLAGKIEQLLANEGEAKAKAQRARQKFLDQYEIKALEEKLCAMVHKCLDRSG